MKVSDDEEDDNDDQTLTVKSDDVSLLEFVRALKFTNLEEEQQPKMRSLLKSSLKQRQQQQQRTTPLPIFLKNH